MHLHNLLPDFSREFVENCARLGRLDWLGINRQDGLGTEFEIKAAVLAKDPQAAAFMHRMSRRAGKSGLVLCFLDCVGQLAVKGPKLFRPTVEQCEAMEHVEVRIPMTDYAQPYEAMVVEFPEAYRKSLEIRSKAMESGRKAPRHVFLRHWPETTVFYSVARFGEEEVAYLFQDRPEFPTAEEALKIHHGKDGADQVIAEAMTRVCMNLCLLLTNHPTRVAPSNPTALAKAQRRRDSNGLNGYNFEARTHVHLITFDREVVVRGKQKKRPAAGGTHASPQPHWRRGHWRNQPCGAGKTETRRVLIPPVFVREEELVGGLEQTSTTYVS